MYINENLSNKQIITLIVVFVFLIFLSLFFYFFFNKNYDDAKLNKKYDFVYKRKSQYERANVHIPYINIKGNDAAIMNEEIAQIESEFAPYSKNKIGFVFNKSNHILSVSVKVLNYQNEYQLPETAFKTFILNLKTRKIYTKEEIYKDYGVNDTIVTNSIAKQFRKMYKQVVKEGYVDPNECNYECFLKWRNVNDYLEGAQLYIENRMLIAFRGFDTGSIFEEEDYFKSSDFKFKISK